MRTFLALEPSAELRTRITRLCRDLEPLFPRLRWSAPESIHLTLRFLGEIDPAGLTALVEAVGEAAAGCAAPHLAAASAGWFGPPRQPRVIWLGLQPSAELERLAVAVESAVQRAGFGAADKPFKAHLTLARPKNPPPRPLDRAALERATGPDWPLWEPRRVLVIKSTLRPEGPLYETLAALSLGDSGAAV